MEEQESRKDGKGKQAKGEGKSGHQRHVQCTFGNIAVRIGIEVQEGFGAFFGYSRVFAFSIALHFKERVFL